jgi:hypothetical protein
MSFVMLHGTVTELCVVPHDRQIVSNERSEARQDLLGKSNLLCTLIQVVGSLMYCICKKTCNTIHIKCTFMFVIIKHCF